MIPQVLRDYDGGRRIFAEATPLSALAAKETVEAIRKPEQIMEHINLLFFNMIDPLRVHEADIITVGKMGYRLKIQSAIFCAV